MNVEVPSLEASPGGIIYPSGTATGWTLRYLDLVFGSRSGVYSDAADLTVDGCRMAYNCYDGFGTLENATNQLVTGCVIEYHGRQARDIYSGDGKRRQFQRPSGG